MDEPTATLPASEVPHHDHAFEVRRDAYTTALYVAICLLAVLTSTARHGTIEQGTVFELIWGTTVGLALAHWFAFRLSSRLAREGTLHRADIDTGVGQFVGAAVVAGVASVPVILFPISNELNAARLSLAGFIGVIGYTVARYNDATRPKAILYGAAELILALTVALVKNFLGGH